MDRRSWLWRRKSSEKSPSGETDSSAGSVSSHSERCSDDQALSNPNVQSPEVTSKAVPGNEDFSDTVKTLSDKLSEALLNIRAKEDLVKQHAKVAEEAVSGWEKAETEVLTLKRQVEVLTQKNSVLDERVGHLDGALKECLRQLRQAREEQEQKIHEAIAKRSSEWESMKSSLENQLNDLQTQLQTAETEALTSTFPDLCIKLETAEKENCLLKNELLSRDEELKIRTTERDLSTRAAETASKQNLENIKKVTKLEAEYRRLKMLTRRASQVNDHRSVTASSVYVESFTDSQSDSGERLSLTDTDACKLIGKETNDCEPGQSNPWASALIAELDQFKSGKTLGRNFMSPSDEIDLMDDFLEMERLAALSGAEKGRSGEPGGHVEEYSLKAELDTLTSRTAELEAKLEKMEEEKVKLTMILTECQDQLRASTDKLEESEVKLIELKSQLAIANQARRSAETEHDASKVVLKNSTEDLEKAEVCIVQLQTQLAITNDAKTMAENEVQATNEKLLKSAAHADELEVKIIDICNQLAIANKEKSESESELHAINKKKEAAESRVKVLELELKSLHTKVCNLEDELLKERASSAEAVSYREKHENEILRMKLESQHQKSAMVGNFKFNQDRELAVAASKFAECQKTIASLGQQLSYLATMPDFLMDSEHSL